MQTTRAPLQGKRVCYGADASEPAVVRVVAARGRVTATAIPRQDATFLRDLARGVPCAGCLSSRESFARWIEAPFASGAKAAKVFPTLLDIQLPFPLESCLYAFLNPARAGVSATRALAVASRVADVEKAIEAFRSAGLDPWVLDAEPLALWTQSLRESPPAAGAASALRAVVYLGRERATLVVGRDTEFLNAHPMKAASAEQIGRLLRADLAGAGGAPASEPAGAAGTAVPVAVQWFWAGSGATDGPRVAALHAALSAAWPGPSQVHDEPATFLARAAAIRALVPGPLRCNLRAGALLHPALARSRRRRANAAAAAGLAAGLLLCAMNLCGEGWIRRREARLDHEFAALRDAVAGYRVGGARGEQAVRIVREAVGKRTASLRPFRDAFKPSLLRVIEAILDAGARHGLRYDSLTLSRDEVSVSGVGPGWNSADPLVPALSRLGYVVGPPRRKEALDDERIPFVIGTGGARE